MNPALLEFLKQMFLHKNITPQQKHGFIVCLPNSNGYRTPDGCRPVSFLTTEYKRIARIMPHRLRHVLQGHLHKSQFFRVPGNSILEAVSLVRDVTAYSESSGHILCPFSRFPARLWSHLLSITFQILHRCGISDWFIERLHALYENATGSVQINGAFARPIPIQTAVRQGCPLSMVLLHFGSPLTSYIRRNPSGHQTRPQHAERSCSRVRWRRNRLCNPNWRFRLIRQAVRCYEQAREAKLNSQKSKALAIGNWTHSTTALGIEFHAQVKS